jgi:glycosyltransferase involved in cell wall biosynthesis
MRPVTAQIRTIRGSHSESGRVVVNGNTGAGRDVDGSRPFSRSRPEGGKVSVVIPCYNQARFLGEAIQSVLCQGYPDLEIIVVDDGSEDSTEEVASGYTKKDPRVRLIRQDNKGLAAARNRGLSEAGGEYVVFLDSDDRLVLEALEVGVRELEAHPGCAFVSGICRKITADGSIVPEWEQFRVRDDPYLELLRSCPVYVPAVMYRRSVFDAVGGFDTSYKAAEDYDLYYRILERFPVYCHDTLVAEIRRHEANMTRDRTLMLKYNMAALRSQRKRVKEDARYKAAYKAGERLWRDWHGDPCGQSSTNSPPRGAVVAGACGNAGSVTLLPARDPPCGQSGRGAREGRPAPSPTTAGARDAQVQAAAAKEAKRKSSAGRRPARESAPECHERGAPKDPAPQGARKASGIADGEAQPAQRTYTRP